MRSVNVAELKNRLSKYLRFAKGGEGVVIRDRNLPVAKLGVLGRQRARPAVRSRSCEPSGSEPDGIRARSLVGSLVEVCSAICRLHRDKQDIRPRQTRSRGSSGITGSRLEGSSSQ